MNDNAILEMTESLIKKFIINIIQIINNSDNEMEDMLGEAYLVVYENYKIILSNERVFINELKKKCLRNNKYGKRIESSKRWTYFNQLEESLPERMGYSFEINTDKIVGLDTIKQYVSKDEYDFLIYYYDWGLNKTASEYDIKPGACRQRVHRIKKRILKEMSS